MGVGEDPEYKGHEHARTPGHKEPHSLGTLRAALFIPLLVEPLEEIRRQMEEGGW